MAPLDAETHRRAALERRERDVAAREAELAGGRMWRALLWRVRLVPLRLVELVVGSWLTVPAIVAGTEVLRAVRGRGPSAMAAAKSRARTRERPASAAAATPAAPSR
jgi:hypothetical protein